MVLKIPLMLVIGKQSKPILFAAAGVHGDEYEGMKAISKVYNGLEPDMLDGSFVGIPICNIMAYQAMSRTTPPHIDGLNLGRVFPGRADGQPTERLAFHLINLIERILTSDDLLIDLHSGGIRYTFLPTVAYRNYSGDALEKSVEAARSFGMQNLWEVEALPGRLTTEVIKHAIPCIGAEVTGNGQCREEDVKLYTNGLINSLKFLGILGGNSNAYVELSSKRTISVYTNEAGFFNSCKEVGSDVKRGELVGTITSPFGEVISRIKSTQDGIIWAMRAVSQIWQGELIAYIAHE